MHVDLQPAGWRLVSSESLDEARARAMLRRDLDAFEEAASTADRCVKVAVTGPLTLAAGVERPRGDKVLADHGARRELAESLAEGISVHAREVRARFPHAQLVVQIDEPMLPTVLAGNVPTASGFSRHRAVRVEEARGSLTGVLSAARAAGAVPIVHSCAGTVDVGLLRSAGADAVSIDLSALIRPDGKGLAGGVDADTWSEAIDDGMLVFAGIVASRDPAGRPPDAISLTRRLLTWWGWLDFDQEQASRSLSVTPTCGLAAASPEWGPPCAHALAPGGGRTCSTSRSPTSTPTTEPPLGRRSGTQVQRPVRSVRVACAAWPVPAATEATSASFSSSSQLTMTLESASVRCRGISLPATLCAGVR